MEAGAALPSECGSGALAANALVRRDGDSLRGRGSYSLSLATVLLLTLSLLCSAGAAIAQTTVRVGALQYGTVSWELDTIRHHELDRAEGIRIEVRPVGSPNAAQVALQSGAVDVIVNDWIWVSRQRGNGRRWTFYPWSLAVGSIMTNPDAGIETLADVDGERFGVAGGPWDKSWLLLRAYYRQRFGGELTDRVEPVFAAPPLLNQLMLGGDLAIVSNYWHYTARLQAAGMSALIRVEQMLPALGIEHEVPLLGWVFSEQWARDNPEAIAAFLRASTAAKERLAESEAEWRRLRPLTNAEDDATFAALRAGFRAGIPAAFGGAEIDAARKLFKVLAREGGEALTGGHSTLAEGTFWRRDEESGR